MPLFQDSHTPHHPEKNERGDEYCFNKILPPREKHTELQKHYSEKKYKLKNKEQPGTRKKQVISGVIPV